MNEKKHGHYESPNLGKLQAVEIDRKTTIFIALDADPVEAKQRYLFRNEPKAANPSF